MKLLIIGLGSIGRKHLSVLQSMGVAELAALRTRKGTLSKETDIVEFDKQEDALAYKPDGVIVCNPTSMHVSSVEPFLQAGAKALIEKPIAHTQEEANKLAPFAEQIRVAYCMRFLPVSNYVRSEIDASSIYKVSFKRSFYLPKWHPYADYRKEYTAVKALGGGVIRTLSHEIDLGIHWLGTPISSTGVVDTLSNLELDVDDFAFLSMKMQNGARVNLEMDYFSPYNVNEGELFTDKGKYEWTASGLYFTVYNETEPRQIQVFNDVFNEMYHSQMDDFIDYIKTGKSLNCTFQEALNVNKVIEDTEQENINTSKS